LSRPSVAEAEAITHRPASLEERPGYVSSVTRGRRRPTGAERLDASRMDAYAWRLWEQLIEAERDR
jgi:hypothetical protein